MRMCVCLHVGMCTYIQVFVEVDHLELKLTGSCEVLDMGVWELNSDPSKEVLMA